MTRSLPRDLRPSWSRGVRLTALAFTTTCSLLPHLACRAFDRDAAPKAEGPNSAALETNQKGLREGALKAAQLCLNAFRGANQQAIADAIEAEIKVLAALELAPVVTPQFGAGFFPPPLTEVANPYLDALHRWTKDFLQRPEAPLEISNSQRQSLFPRSSIAAMRAAVVELENLIFLVFSPLSQYRYNADLTQRLLTRIYTYSYDYARHGATAIGEPNTTLHALDDWFASPSFLYALRLVQQTMLEMVPPTFQKAIQSSLEKSAAALMAQPKERSFSNRQLYLAESLWQTGTALSNETQRNFATDYLLSAVNSIYEDGGLPFWGQQNPNPQAQAAAVMTLARLYAQSGSEDALVGLKKMKNFARLNLHQGRWEQPTAPYGSTSWGINGLVEAYEAVAFAAADAGVRGIVQQHLSTNGTPPSALLASYYTARAGLPPAESFLYFDRNLQGPRGLLGDLRWAMSGRKVDTPEFGDAGALALATASMTKKSIAASAKDGSPHEEWRLQAVYPSIVQNGSATGSIFPPNGASLRGDVMAASSLAENATAFAASSRLMVPNGQRGATYTHWRSQEMWLASADRLMFAIEIAPLQEQLAYEVAVVFDAILKSDASPKSEPILELKRGLLYRHGEVYLRIHRSDLPFASMALKATPDEGSLLVFSDRESGEAKVQRSYKPEQAMVLIVEVSREPEGEELQLLSEGQANTAPGLWSSSMDYKNADGLRVLTASFDTQSYALWFNPESEERPLDAPSLLPWPKALLWPAVGSGQNPSLIPGGSAPSALGPRSLLLLQKSEAEAAPVPKGNFIDGPTPLKP